jgi:hypothetical protein
VNPDENATHLPSQAALPVRGCRQRQTFRSSDTVPEVIFSFSQLQKKVVTPAGF